MDLIDVSEESDYVTHLRSIQAATEKAGRRKGQMVRSHPPAQHLISEFMAKRLASTMGPMSSNSTHYLVATSQIPSPYVPCRRHSGELQPIMISDMKLETHHRGSQVMLHVLTPPNRMTAVMAIVEDEQGTAVLLQLYHQPEESVVPAAEIVRQGGVCILKEPFFKCTADGSYSLRVDHLSDVIWLTSGDERIPNRWRRPISASDENSTSIRMRGNDAVKTQKWAEAQRLYSSAIQVAEKEDELQLAHLNRSLANLRIGYQEQALSDATQDKDGTNRSEKGLFRESRALYDLGEFAASLEKLQVLKDSYPENAAANTELDRVKTRLQEQEAGEYDFHRMYKQARQTPPLIDCATFSGPVEIHESPGRGRGLFTTRPVSAGQLLLCEKAFAYSFADDDKNTARGRKILMNMDTKRMIIGGQADLLTQIVQKLYHNPGMVRLFRDLHRGDYNSVPESEADGHPVVDSFLVEKIMSLNAFGAPRTSYRSHSHGMSHQAPSTAERSRYTTSGIWLLASRINHSCVGNCRRSFIGDMHLVRATKDLPSGTELSFPYQVPSPMESYEETQKRLSTWGFTCSCELCLEKRSTSQATLHKRRVLLREIERKMVGFQMAGVPQFKQLVNQLEETYPRPESNVARIELGRVYGAFGASLLAAHRFLEAIKALVKGLEASGYRIDAHPPIGDAGQPRFEVLEWGVASEPALWSLLHLHRAYKVLAPELNVTTKRYCEITYAIIVGENETAADAYPDIYQDTSKHRP